MYTGEGGYLSQPAAVKAQLIAAVDAAIQADLYVIIDWHILSDGNPAAHTDQAVAFFTEMAQRYGDNPAVLFEICNEPNGNITWSGNVKPYAQRVVSAIRAYAPRSIILVGSPTWSQDIHQAAADPLQGTNLMYTLHFYAGTHGDWLRQRADQALAQGLPSSSQSGAPAGLTAAAGSIWPSPPVAGLFGVPGHQLGQLVPVRQERDLCRPETGDLPPTRSGPTAT